MSTTYETDEYTITAYDDSEAWMAEQRQQQERLALGYGGINLFGQDDNEGKSDDCFEFERRGLNANQAVAEVRAQRRREAAKKALRTRRAGEAKRLRVDMKQPAKTWTPSRTTTKYLAKMGSLLGSMVTRSGWVVPLTPACTLSIKYRNGVERVMVDVE
jgi:hypothetical protein